MDDSSVTKAYKMMGVLLLPYGFSGLVVFVAKNFIAMPLIYTAQVYIGMAMPIVAIILLLLSLYKSIAREKCSEDRVYQCLHDGTVTNIQKWDNQGYEGQSREHYLLAYTMFMTWKATFKYVDMDTILAEKAAKKAEGETTDESTDETSDSSEAAATL